MKQCSDQFVCSSILLSSFAQPSPVRRAENLRRVNVAVVRLPLIRISSTHLRQVRTGRPVCATRSASAGKLRAKSGRLPLGAGSGARLGAAVFRTPHGRFGAVVFAGGDSGEFVAWECVLVSCLDVYRFRPLLDAYNGIPHVV